MLQDWARKRTYMRSRVPSPGIAARTPISSGWAGVSQMFTVAHSSLLGAAEAGAASARTARATGRKRRIRAEVATPGESRWRHPPPRCDHAPYADGGGDGGPAR